jgi:addiction module RelB/DinJ family antitoxin
MVMKTVLNVKTDLDNKRQATQVAMEMGVPLSIVVTSFLKKFINDRELVLEAPRQMSVKLEKVIAKAHNDLKKGKLSPAFSDVDSAISWLSK